MFDLHAGTTHRGNHHPRVWLLNGPRPGDNNQVLGLGETLGWPFELKSVGFHSSPPVPKMISSQLRSLALAGVDRRRSSALQAPWPDLVISAGRELEPVARWIKKQSGNRARLVHMGRPWSRLDAFDLIISTPQYFLPERENILLNELPLHRVTDRRLEEARALWEPRFAHLPRPYTVVLLGGNSGSFVLSCAKARRLGKLVNALTRGSGGSLLVTSSARTPADAYHDFLDGVGGPRHVHHWGAQENPYFGYLALADRIVITGESVSMLAEANVTGKPLLIYDIAERPAPDMPPWQRLAIRLSYRSLRDLFARTIGAPHMQRDIGAIQRHLVSIGRAQWLDEASFGSAASQQPWHAPRLDAQRAASRVQNLLAGVLSC